MHTRRLLILTFTEMLATIAVERGLFFFAHNHLAFDEVANLWLSLAFGFPYVVGALVSHGVSIRMGEKRALVWTLLATLAAHILLLGFGRTLAGIFLLDILIGFLQGLKWPIVESYVAAGRVGDDTTRTIGGFNLAWAGAVPIGMLLTGPANAFAPPLLFLVPAGINAIALWLIRPLPPAPGHIPDEHPHRPPAETLARMRALLNSCRWLLLMSYCCFWIVSALMPSILDSLGVATAIAPGVAGLLDVFRVLTFGLLVIHRGWVESTRFLLWLALLLPVSFFAMLLGATVATVLAGEFFFGLAMGGIYVAAIYYAMVVKNASVDAGGKHEAMIGCGFTIGPLVGLLAFRLSPVLGSRLAGTLVGIGPLIVICLAAAFRSLCHVPRGGR